VWIVKTVGSHGPGPAPRPEKSTESSRPRAWSRPYHWDCSKFCSLLPVITSACQIPLDRPLFVTVMNWCVLAGFWPALPLNGLYFYPLIPFAMNLCHLCQKRKKELLLLRQPLAPRFTFCTESKKQNLCSTRSNL
jgi:hypothetical protein